MPTYENSYGTLTTFERPKADLKASSNAVELSDLTPEQLSAVKNLLKWHASGELLITLAGFAGTGKSTITGIFSKSLQDAGKSRIAFCTYTGKASGVVMQKLAEAGFDVSDPDCYIGTIHGLIYRPVIDEKTGRIVSWEKHEHLDYDLLVIDEASMVNEELYNDLKIYGIPILAIGDHGQLPPITGALNLVADPMLRLETIHRQAEGNPIIALSKAIRETGSLPLDFPESDTLRILPKRFFEKILRAKYENRSAPDLQKVACLSYTNKARVRVNNFVSSLRNTGNERVQEGEQVICLKNKRFAGFLVYNGMRGYVKSAKKFTPFQIDLSVAFPEDYMELQCYCPAPQFGREKTFASLEEFDSVSSGVTDWQEVGMLFDYGYCVTTHKAQGSSFEDVVFFYERPAVVDAENFKKFLYTSVTRSSEDLTIVMDR